MEDPPEKVGCRKESYFVEFMYVDVARDFVGVVFHVLLDGAKGSFNHRDCCLVIVDTTAAPALYIVGQ